jgi:hypothetical protein
MADLLRDFWIRETGTGQQVAQLHDIYYYYYYCDDVEEEEEEEEEEETL